VKQSKLNIKNILCRIAKAVSDKIYNSILNYKYYILIIILIVTLIILYDISAYAINTNILESVNFFPFKFKGKSRDDDDKSFKKTQEYDFTRPKNIDYHKIRAEKHKESFDNYDPIA
jgi:hypothetical protein